jgi:DNA-3-methyladenine glycosylase II
VTGRGSVARGGFESETRADPVALRLVTLETCASFAEMSSTLQERRIHARIVGEARAVSAELAAALGQSGPVTLLRRNSRSLPDYLCRVVVGQQLSTGAARTIWGRVEQLAREEALSVVKLAGADSAHSLRECGVSRQKIAALADIARAYCARRLGVTRLERMSHEERSVRLCEIRGIGQWTCDMTSIFYFGDPDVWPSGDLSVTQELGRFVSEARMPGALERFRPYRSYLAVSMYRLRDGS